MSGLLANKQYIYHQISAIKSHHNSYINANIRVYKAANI